VSYVDVSDDDVTDSSADIRSVTASHTAHDERDD